MPKTADLRSGFTLVELALVSFLIAVGLLGVYALLRSGLESGEAQERDVRGALFSESSFGTLDAAADEASLSGGGTNWMSFFEMFFEGSTNLPLVGATEEEWKALGDTDTGASDFTDAVPSHLLGGKGRHAYLFASTYDDGDTVVTGVSNTVWYEFGEPTWVCPGDETNALAVTLHVWPESPSSTAQTYFRIFSLRQRDAGFAPSGE